MSAHILTWKERVEISGHGPGWAIRSRDAEIAELRAALASQHPRRARKIGGSYQADGTIVSEFRTLAGEPRFVFEFDTPKGLLHIFGPGQVEFDAPPPDIENAATVGQWRAPPDAEDQACVACEICDGTKTAFGKHCVCNNQEKRP